MTNKNLWIVYYHDESSGENDFVWVVAKDYQEAETTALEDLKDNYGLESIKDLDVNVIDCFEVKDAFDKDGKGYQISLNEGILSEAQANRREEEYLFKLARKTLEWAGVKISKRPSNTGADEESLADLVMLDLINIKK